MTFIRYFLSSLAIAAAGLGLAPGVKAQVPTSFDMRLADPGTTDFVTSTGQSVGFVSLLVDVQSAGVRQKSCASPTARIVPRLAFFPPGLTPCPAR